MNMETAADILHATISQASLTFHLNHRQGPQCNNLHMVCLGLSNRQRWGSERVDCCHWQSCTNQQCCQNEGNNLWETHGHGKAKDVLHWFEGKFTLEEMHYFLNGYAKAANKGTYLSSISKLKKPSIAEQVESVLAAYHAKHGNQISGGTGRGATAKAGMAKAIKQNSVLARVSCSDFYLGGRNASDPDH